MENDVTEKLLRINSQYVVVNDRNPNWQILSADTVTDIETRKISDEVIHLHREWGVFFPTK